ncbi:MAG: hypothetical protein SPG61_07855 [Arcanobacterium sp.]|nr:hypothetical protein [Arcanobacterium sp.]
MTEPVDFMQLLRWGNADGMLFALEALNLSERAAAMAPLRDVAKKIDQSAMGDFAAEWDGPLSSGHTRAATIALFPTLEHLLRAVPTDKDFIETDIYALFPHQLGKIMQTWTQLFASRPQNYDLQAYLQYGYKWWDFNEIHVVFDPAFTMTTLHTLNPPQLLEFCLYREEFAYNLFYAAFHQAPPAKMVNLEQIDGGMIHSTSIAGLVIPTLINIGTLKQDEVLKWCDAALAIPERRKSDLQWFQRLRKFLKENELSRLSNPTPRYWLEPYPQLLKIYREINAGISHPEVAPGSELETLLPLLEVYERSTWGGIMQSVQSFLLADDAEVLPKAAQALKDFGFAGMALTLENAREHWLISHKAPLEQNQMPSDEVYEKDDELDQKWMEQFSELQQFIEEKVEIYAQELGLIRD